MSDLEDLLVAGACPLLLGQEVNGTTNKEVKNPFTVPTHILIRPELGDISRKNWTYLTNEVALMIVYWYLGKGGTYLLGRHLFR